MYFYILPVIWKDDLEKEWGWKLECFVRAALNSTEIGSNANGLSWCSTVLRQGEDLAENPGKAVMRKVAFWKSRAAFPGRSFTISKHFVFSCKGEIWDNVICTHGRGGCCWNKEGAGWEVCTPKYCTLPWGMAKKQSYKLLLRPVRSFVLLQELCALERTMQLSKPREPVWVNQAPRTHFVISPCRLRNPARRTGVGCIPKQKSINILVKTLQWSGSGKICIKISKQTLLPNSSV